MNETLTLTSSDIISISALITSLLTSIIFGILAYYQNKKISNLQKKYMSKENNRLRLLDVKQSMIKLRRENDKHWNIFFEMQGDMNNNEINKRREAAYDAVRTVGKIVDLYLSIKSILPEHEVRNIDSHHKKMTKIAKDPVEEVKIQLEFVTAFEKGLDNSLIEK